MLILLSISQVSSQTMSVELLDEPQAKEEIFQTDATGALAPAEPVWLERLASDPKLLNTQAILAPFARGEAETAVIVTLEPTPAAHDLAAQSADALNRPDAFDQTESPVFFDLQDQTIRTQLRETVTQAVGQFIANQPKAGLTVTQRFSYQFGFAARVSPAALEQLLADPAVLRVEEDGLMEPHLRQGIPLMAADTPSATFTGSGLSIAIVDTGIDTSHPQLGGGSSIFNSKVIGGYDTGDNDADPRPNSSTGEAHGTACAGIAAGDLGDSGDYIGGVAPGAKLYALKITSGDGGSATNSAMIAAWEWAISHKKDDPANPILIISTSFGGGGYSSACDSSQPGLTNAAANAVAAGITIFASSGNDGFCSYISSPACISYVNSVGAVYDANIGEVGFCVNASYSCATPQYSGYCSTGYNAVFENTAADKVTAYSNSASFLTLFAPSHNAYTTDIKGAGGYASGDYDDAFGGTSAACPYAAGAAAVLQSAAKAKTGNYLTPAQVKSYLTSYGTTITDGKVTSVQKPRINLASAVNALPVTQSTVSVTASDPTATEADLTTGTFTFTRSGVTTAALTVNYTVSGTATAGSDYTALGTSVTFAAGQSTATQTVTPVQDTLVESDETVILTLAAGTGYTVGTASSATVTLSSDDTNTVTVSASDATADEAGLTTGTFSFSRSGDTSAVLTVNYTVSGTATAGSDYTALGTSVTFAAGQSTATQTVTPVQDTLVEIDETVILTLAAGTGYTVDSPSSATVTLISDDISDTTTVSVIASDATASESGADLGTFTFKRTGSIAAALTVNYTVSGTATSGSDYQTLGTSVIFAEGASTTNKTVTPLQDTLVESDESVILTLATGSGYTIGTPANATVMIVNVNAHSPNARIAAGTHSLFVAGDGSLRAWGFNDWGQVGNGMTTNSSLPTQILTGVAAVAAGQAHSLALKTDGSLWAWGYNGNGALGDGTTTNSSLPKQILTGVAAVAAGFWHSLALKTDGSLWVWGNGSSLPTQVLTGVAAMAAGAGHNLALKTDGSLLAWGDNSSGQLGDGTSTPSSLPKQILTNVAAVEAGHRHSLAIKNDGTLWAWGRNFEGQLGDGTNTDCSLPKLILTGVDAVAAGQDHTLALKSDGILWAWGWNSYGQLGDGTTTNRTTPTPVLAGVTAMAAGQNHSLALKTDGSLWAWGRNEFGALGDGTTSNRFSPGLVDTTSVFVNVAASRPTVTEWGTNTGSFTFSRTGSTAATLTVPFTVGGTAVAGSDYTPLSGTSVTFPAGVSMVTQTITPLDDTLVEADETVTLTLIAGSGYKLGSTASATVMIVSEDFNVVTITATSTMATEAGLQAGTFTFTRTGDTTAVLPVNYTVGGTATPDSDYVSLGTGVAFAAGESTTTLTVSPLQDTSVEPDETIILTLAAGTGYIIGFPYNASTVTLTSDDTNTLTTVSVTATDTTATEADLTTGTFTFTRSGDTSTALTVNYSVSGTATSGSDYQILGTSIRFAAGESTATQTVTPVQDTLVESDETVILTLAAGTGYTVGTASSATVTLSSDDTLPGEDLTIKASDILGNGVHEFQATGNITVMGEVNVRNGVQLIISAGKKIVFQPGFKVEAGGRLNAHIGTSP